MVPETAAVTNTLFSDRNMISRRRFLLWSAASAAAMLHGAPLYAAPGKLAAGEYFLIGDGVRGSESLAGEKPYASQPGRVKAWRYDQPESMEIRLPFFPHSFVSHPGTPNRVITFEKWGRHLAEIDLASRTVVRVTQAPAGRRFFGHGAHAGSYIYATQMDDIHGRGIVAVLDGNDHRVLHEFETQGAYPHDCQWLGEDGTLMVVNSRSRAGHGAANENRSSLVWVDARTGKCLDQRYIKTGAFGYAHLARSADGYLVLSGSHDVAGGRSMPLLAIVRPDGSEQVVDMARSAREPLQGEVLSLYLNDSTGQLFATLPSAARVQAWNYRSGELQQQFTIAEPRGLAYSDERKSLLVSSAQARSLYQLDGSAGAMDFMPLVSGQGGNGSHLCRLKL